MDFIKFNTQNFTDLRKYIEHTNANRGLNTPDISISVMTPLGKMRAYIDKFDNLALSNIHLILTIGATGNHLRIINTELTAEAIGNFFLILDGNSLHLDSCQLLIRNQKFKSKNLNDINEHLKMLEFKTVVKELDNTYTEFLNSSKYVIKVHEIKDNYILKIFKSI